MDAGQKFPLIERLCQIVVGAGIQAADAVVQLGFCRQHQDGCSLTPGAQTPGNLIAVYLGQHNIQDQQVIDVKLCIGKTAFSVIGCLGNKAAAR